MKSEIEQLQAEIQSLQIAIDNETEEFVKHILEGELLEIKIKYQHLVDYQRRLENI